MQSTTTITTMPAPQSENISPTERSSFLSKVRSRFVSGRKMSNNMSSPTHAKTSPYSKPRSVDFSHQPFASQPAIVNRVPLVVTRDSSDDSTDTPTSSRGPISPPASDRRHSMQGRVVFSLSSPPEPKATRSTQPTIDGLPLSTNVESILLSSKSNVSASHAPTLPQIQALSPIDVTSSEIPSKQASSASASIPSTNHATNTQRDTVIPPPPIGASHSLPAEPKFAPEAKDRNAVLPTQSASGPSSAGPSNSRKPMPADIPAILLRRGLSSQAAGINTTMRYDPHSVITEEPREDLGATPQPHPLASPYFLGSTPKPPSRLQLAGMAMQRGTGLPPLPPLPLPTPTEASAPRRPNATTRLRSMPTLARMGADGVQEEDEDGSADHENAMLEEDDEEEEFEDAREHPTETEQSGRDTIRTPGPRMDLTGFRKPSRMLSSFTLGTAGGTAMDATTPKANRLMDYFSIKTPIDRKAKTPGVPSNEDTAAGKKSAHPSDASADESDTSTNEDDHDSVAQTPRQNDAALPRPISTSSIRPGITHHASKSMVDLLSSRTERLSTMVKPVKLPPVEGESALRRKEHERDMATNALKRRSSLPHFTIGSPPPPYPEFGPAPGRFRIVPREDEGRERLPEYENGVHLRAIMPRKLEFSAPGVQSKDRKWRRVLCELEGTAFRVYKCPPAAVGVGPLASWWERRVGVPDVSSDPPAKDAAPDTGGGTIDAAGRIRGGATSTTTQTRLEPVPKIGENAPPSATVHPGPPPAPVPVPSPTEARGHSRSVSGSRILFGRKSQSDATRSSLSVNLVAQAARASQDSRRSSLSMLSRPSMSSQESQGSWEEVETPVSTVPEPVPDDLLRTYTLQHAESGLGSDYNKRKNVIRVRLEGEQFLLQAQDVASVVDWIEGLQAATNIALDLDERPMPRGPLFPRRRRRRVRRPDATAGPGGTTAPDANTTAAGAPAT